MTCHSMWLDFKGLRIAKAPRDLKDSHVNHLRKLSPGQRYSHPGRQMEVEDDTYLVTPLSREAHRQGTRNCSQSFGGKPMHGVSVPT